MKVKFHIIAFSLLLGFNIYAQDQDSTAQKKDTTYWSSGGFIGVTFSQVSLSKSWAAGGNSNITLTNAASVFANFKKGRTSWDNSLDLGYGGIKQTTNGENQYSKTDDKIILVSKFGHQIKANNSEWFFSGLLNFQTQFAPGYTKSSTGTDSVISKFMAPGYLVVGLGVDFKPTSNLSFNYTPLTGKLTFVEDKVLSDKGAYGVTPGHTMRAELGSFLMIKYKGDIVKNVNLDTRLQLFTNYLKTPLTVDVNWQNTFIMKINSFLSANWYTQLIYDHDINSSTDPGQFSAKIQWKSVFGVGLAYNFGAQKNK